VEKEVLIKMNPQKTGNKTPTEEVGYYIAPDTYRQIQKSREDVLKSDLDRVFVVDGREGFAGKSTFTFQIAHAYDPTFCLDRIVFNSKDFSNVLRNAKKGQAIVFDEAFRGLSSKGSLSKENKKIVQLLMEVRQRNLFIFIVLPSFFMLEKYVGIFRSHCLFHCFSSKKTTKRRYYKVYNYANKKLLYIFGKQLMNYHKPKISKAYRFYAKFPPTINRDDYIAKKLAAFKDFDTEEEKEDHKWKKERDFGWYLLNKKFKMTQQEISDIYKKVGFKYDRSNIAKIIKDVAKNCEL
jgi:hypothetical protein